MERAESRQPKTKEETPARRQEFVVMQNPAFVRAVGSGDREAQKANAPVLRPSKREDE